MIGGPGTFYEGATASLRSADCVRRSPHVTRPGRLCSAVAFPDASRSPSSPPFYRSRMIAMRFTTAFPHGRRAVRPAAFRIRCRNVHSIGQQSGKVATARVPALKCLTRHCGTLPAGFVGNLLQGCETAPARGSRRDGARVAPRSPQGGPFRGRLRDLSPRIPRSGRPHWSRTASGQSAPSPCPGCDAARSGAALIRGAGATAATHRPGVQAAAPVAAPDLRSTVPAARCIASGAQKVPHVRDSSTAVDHVSLIRAHCAASCPRLSRASTSWGVPPRNLGSSRQGRRGWPGRRPAMTEQQATGERGSKGRTFGVWRLMRNITAVPVPHLIARAD